MHMTAMAPYLRRLKQMVPDHIRSRWVYHTRVSPTAPAVTCCCLTAKVACLIVSPCSFELAEFEVARALQSHGKATETEVDGLCPLFAYRRLLLLAHRLRALKYEEDPDFTGKA
jgi:hypothetical protein